MLLLAEVVPEGIPRTNLVILMGGVLIMLSADIREAMVLMSDLPMLQIRIPLGIITTVRRGM